MNVEDGRILMLEDNQIAKALGEAWADVPDELQDDAKALYDAMSSRGLEPRVNLNDGSRLAMWAEQQRKKNYAKKKKRNKIAKQSRRRNHK